MKKNETILKFLILIVLSAFSGAFAIIAFETKGFGLLFVLTVLLFALSLFGFFVEIKRWLRNIKNKDEKK